MDAQDFTFCMPVLENGTEGHPLEQVVHSLENRARVIYVFTETLSTLRTESIIFVDVAVFVATA